MPHPLWGGVMSVTTQKELKEIIKRKNDRTKETQVREKIKAVKT